MYWSGKASQTLRPATIGAAASAVLVDEAGGRCGGGSPFAGILSFTDSWPGPLSHSSSKASEWPESQSFAPPALFADDLLSAVPGIDDIPGSKRARYWFAGGARTGTFLHVDPFCTSAWNVCVAGRKRWALLPPSATIADARAAFEAASGREVDH